MTQFKYALLGISFVASVSWIAQGAEAAQPPNVLLICVDDLRPELKSFGVDYIHSPNIDRLAARGRGFSRHYVQAPTCGASRFAMLTGRYAHSTGERGNGALVARSQQMHLATPSFPEHFRQHGYTTVSIGKVSHHPGGLFGKNWADPNKIEMPGAWTRHLLPAGPWQHPEGFMHGLANGEIRRNAKDMDLFQAFDGPDDSYPDGFTIDGAIEQLDLLAKSKKPFLLAVGILRPHLPFGAPAKYGVPYQDVQLAKIPHPDKPEGRTTWHGSGEFMKYNRWNKDPRDDELFATEVRKHYAACVTYADAMVGRVIARLEENGLADNTIVVLWGDHGWHLGEHAIWGKHSLFEESLRSPLIICAPEVVGAGKLTDSVVETIDLYPTLCDLAKIPRPKKLDGTSLLPLLKDPTASRPMSESSAISYQRNRETIRTDRYRLIRHRKNGRLDFVELYDHQSKDGETVNIAESHADLADKLMKQLDDRLGL